MEDDPCREDRWTGMEWETIYHPAGIVVDMANAWTDDWEQAWIRAQQEAPLRMRRRVFHVAPSADGLGLARIVIRQNTEKIRNAKIYRAHAYRDLSIVVHQTHFDTEAFYVDLILKCELARINCMREIMKAAVRISVERRRHFHHQ